MTTKGKSYLTGEEVTTQGDPLANVEYFFGDKVTGPYALTAEAKYELDTKAPDKQRITCVLAQRKIRGLIQPILIVSSAYVAAGQGDSQWVRMSIPELLAQYPQTASSLLDQALLNVSLLLNHPSELFDADPRTRWLVYGFDSESCDYVLTELSNLGYVRMEPKQNLKLGSHLKYRITTPGWERIEALRLPTSLAAAIVSTEHDVFISHAHEDKESFVRGLATELKKCGLSVWYDEWTLELGDSLRQKIDEGLARSRYGVVVLSRGFFAKNWPQAELDGLMSRETQGRKVILPVRHRITCDEVSAYSPILAGRLSVGTEAGIPTIAAQIHRIVRASKA